MITPNNIFLVGYMGVGKTTIGKKLAQYLNFDFIDTDSFIEERTKMSISDIFEKKGESYFRILEQEIINNYNSNNTVVATGGGLACHKNNILKINKLGVSIYIKSSVNNIIKNLNKDLKERPILKDKNRLEIFIKNHLNQREKFYYQANIIFETNSWDTNKYKFLLELYHLYIKSSSKNFHSI